MSCSPSIQASDQPTLHFQTAYMQWPIINAALQNCLADTQADSLDDVKLRLRSAYALLRTQQPINHVVAQANITAHHASGYPAGVVCMRAAPLTMAPSCC